MESATKYYSLRILTSTKGFNDIINPLVMVVLLRNSDFIIKFDFEI